MSLPAAIGLPRPRAAVLARTAWLALPAIATLALAAQEGGSRTGDWMPWALVAVLAAGALLAFDILRLRRGFGLAALGCIAGLAIWSGLSVAWAWLPGDAATEASRTLFYASAFAIVLLAIRTQRDAATMVGLIATATGLVTLYGCVRLAQSAPDSFMIYDRVGWPTGYPNTSASLGVLGFWTLVGVGAERHLIWPARALALAAAVPALGFALLTQSRGAALTLILVSPFAIALVRERLRLTAFTFVALAGLLPALPALRTAIDTGTAADAGTAASRLLLGGVIVAAVGAAIALADQRISIPPERRRRLGRGAALVTAIAAVLLLGVALQQGAPGRIDNAFHSFTKVDAAGDGGPHLLSVESNRWDFWKVAASDLSARPLTGYGAGSFGPTYLRRGHSSELPAQAHGQLQELAATLGIPGLLLGSAVGAIGLAGLLRRRKQPSAALAGAAVGTACVLAHAQVDWHWQVPAVALPVMALVACGAALHPAGALVPRRAARIGGGIVLALGLLWVLPGFASERLIERAVANDDPAAARTAATISPFDPAPLRLAAQLEGPGRGLKDALAAANRGPEEWSSWAVVAQLAAKDGALVASACARARSDNPRLQSCP
ncbi:MAG TPA: O-antigen ligase family protein [Gaiellales bacterium]|nr:O-antigen ligase family protein [Gaiellales bacterium]